MFDPLKAVAFDFETSGTQELYALQPWQKRFGNAWATSLAVVKRVNGLAVSGGLNPTREMMAAFLEEAIAEDRTIVGWNTQFDVMWLLAYGLHDLVFKAKWLDAMLLWKHLTNEPEYEVDRAKKKSYSLKRYVDEFMTYMSGYEQEVDFHDPSPEARRKLHAYNVRDTMATLLAAEHIWPDLSPEQQRVAWIEAQSIPMVARANLYGLRIDTVAGRDLSAKLGADAEELMTKLAPYGVTPQLARSPMQLATLLYESWGLPVLKENVGAKTGKVSRSTDKATLHELALIDSRAKLFKDYREALNNRTKFADALVKSAEENGDGRTYPQGIIFGTYSGRMTYSSKHGKGVKAQQTGFPLHQMKSGKDYRGLVIADPDYDLMEFDASGQEFRWMAIKSGDETMLQLCVPGEDAHSYMGAAIAHVDYRDLIARNKAEEKEAKNQRKAGKVANLSLQYRTSAKKLMQVARVQYDIPMEIEEANRIYSTYQETYPGVPQYWRDQIALTRQLGYVETVAGRRVTVDGNWRGSTAWSMESTSINFPIQGTGADQKYLAMAVIKDFLTSIDAYFAWDLHDGIYLWVPKRHRDRAAVSIKALLDNLPYAKAWDFTPPIPLPWDCKVGTSWGNLKEYEYGH